MSDQGWHADRDSRTLRYAGRVLDPERWILLRADEAHASSYDGQVAILTAANLFSRMTPAVVLDIPSVPIVAPLPWAGLDLQDHILKMMYRADPYGRFECRPHRGQDYLVHLGTNGAERIVHGTGWNTYIGPGPSPLRQAAAPNPIGPAMAAILVAAVAFRTNLDSYSETVQLNGFDWEHSSIDARSTELLVDPELGNIWTVGTGSVGTAILYFLTLATHGFSTVLFDMDRVKIHNLDRSPIFVDGHVGSPKVEATASWLAQCGLMGVRQEPCSLDDSTLWKSREAGTPDLVIATANERNVRSVIETAFPPIQIYGTTGSNWQAAAIRHAPLTDPCSCCLFPETDHAGTECATGEVTRKHERVDAALPFLSFAAGAMAAAEILKLTLRGFPFSPNRVVLYTQPVVRVAKVSLAQREGCICQHRSMEVHRQMIAGSRFAQLLP